MKKEDGKVRQDKVEKKRKGNENGKSGWGIEGNGRRKGKEREKRSDE